MVCHFGYSRRCYASLVRFLVPDKTLKRSTELAKHESLEGRLNEERGLSVPTFTRALARSRRDGLLSRTEENRL
ncbi:hypothetical protein MPNT_40005 [Candidatus Methylacidithermus pantelleriae]|uniref:Uncharacterized protein n=1 Tax=Candidatus Methylacidithermus pantelleriae TaxID=2744239 RepID=A0A8J2FT59_9BACT|nr:hypothetical protein MPNT_40005 [Candidatus Methylacidithermus pantelleriae]